MSNPQQQQTDAFDIFQTAPPVQSSGKQQNNVLSEELDGFFGSGQSTTNTNVAPTSSGSSNLGFMDDFLGTTSTIGKTPQSDSKIESVLDAFNKE